MKNVFVFFSRSSSLWNVDQRIVELVKCVWTFWVSEVFESVKGLFVNNKAKKSVHICQNSQLPDPMYTWDQRKLCIIFLNIFLLVKLKVIQKPFVWVRTKIVLPHAPPLPPPPPPLSSHFLSPENNPNYHQHYTLILHNYKLDYS